MLFYVLLISHALVRGPCAPTCAYWHTYVWYSSDTTSREIYDSDSSTLPKGPLVRYNQIQCLSTLSLGSTAQQSQRASLSELPHLELSFVSPSTL